MFVELIDGGSAEITKEDDGYRLFGWCGAGRMFDVRCADAWQLQQYVTPAHSHRVLELGAGL